MWITAPTRSMTFDLTSLTTIKTFTPSPYICLHRLIYHRRMHISPLALSWFLLIYSQPCVQFLNSTDTVSLLRLIEIFSFQLFFFCFVLILIQRKFISGLWQGSPSSYIFSNNDIAYLFISTGSSPFMKITLWYTRLM